MKVWIGILGISLLGQTLTLEKERALGAHFAAEIRKQAQPFNLPEVVAYVERMGARLASFVPGGDFRFEVVVGERAEPIGLPGGFVIVPAAFLLTAEDEAEVAAMIAHAMGHVTLRHGFVNAPKAREGTIPLFFMGGWMGAHASAQDRTSFVPWALLGAMRSNELEADRFGADVAGKAGFDPAALARYVQRLQPEDSGPGAPLPAKQERLAALEDTATRGGEVGGSEFLRVREMVRGALGAPPRKAPSLRRPL